MNYLMVRSLNGAVLDATSFSSKHKAILEKSTPKEIGEILRLPPTEEECDLSVIEFQSRPLNFDILKEEWEQKRDPKSE